MDSLPQGSGSGNEGWGAGLQLSQNLKAFKYHMLSVETATMVL